MIRMLLTAPASGTGKTAVTCALLATLRKRGLEPCAFKCGPDYIDPMFHRAVLGVDSHNLDLFLSDEEMARDLFARISAEHGAAVCEGVMGFYDGVGGTTDQASAWHVSRVLNLPVILIIRAKGSSLTLAAQIKGLQNFRENSGIVGVILNDCTPMLCRTLAPVLERECGLPVLGCLPHLEQAEIESRHLGLYTAAEITDLSQRIDLLAEAFERNVDVDRLLSLCEGKNLASPCKNRGDAAELTKIAVAQDEAFCFTYAESLEALELAGAEIVPFSPMKDQSLPAGVCGLYLPGGYPELYAETLAKNESMRQSIRELVNGGLPTVAECGGFLYLGQSLQDSEKRSWPMAGVLPGEGFPAGKLVRFGYGMLHAKEDSMLFQAGDAIPVHEFHYWDSTANGSDLRMDKPVSNRAWECGFVSESLYASFPHLYFAGQPKLAVRFVAAARKYRDMGNQR